MALLLRYGAVAMVFIAGYLAMTYMQHRFDSSDLQKAIDAVRLAHPAAESPTTIEERLAKELGVSTRELSWEAEWKSKFWGTVFIHARAPQHDDEFIWTVDLARQTVMPVSEASKNLVHPASP